MTKSTTVQNEDQQTSPDISVFIASGVISAIVAILLFCVIANIIQAQFGYMDDTGIDFYMTVVSYYNYGAFQPENVEKLQYAAALIFLPVAMLIGNLVLVDRLKKRPGAAKVLCTMSLCIGATGILVLGFADNAADSFFLSQYVVLETAGLLSVLLAALIVPAIYLYQRTGERIRGLVSRWSGPAYWVCALAMIIPAAFMFLVDKYGIEGTMPSEHLTAVMYSATQVAAGKTMLVDLTCQYGAYAQFLQPIFLIIGMDTFKFFLVMSVLTGITFACLAAFIYFSTRNRFIALTGFAAVVFNGFFYLKVLSLDPYYQYIPLRMIFPALLILSSWLFFKTRKKWLYYAIFVMAAVSVLWSMDTGVVVMGAWLLALAYDEWVRSSRLIETAIKTLKHLAAVVASLLLVFAAFAAYAFLISGSFPDFGLLTEYTGIFYTLGYYMLKMPWLHPWNLVGLVYVAGMSYAILAKLAGKADIRANLIFLLTIMGAGIFSYYQGRSHDYNLVQVWYPAILILILFADMLYERTLAWLAAPEERRGRVINWAAAAALSVILLLFVVSAAGVALDSGPVADKISSNMNAMQDKVQGDMIKNIAFIQENTEPGDPVYIFSRDQAVYYAESGTASPIKIPSDIEVLRMEDFLRISDYLNENPDNARVFVESSYELNADEVLALVSEYRVTGTSENGKMKMYELYNGE